MTMAVYILLLLFVNFVQIQCDGNETTIVSTYSTMSSTATSEVSSTTTATVSDTANTLSHSLLTITSSSILATSPTTQLIVVNTVNSTTSGTSPASNPTSSNTIVTSPTSNSTSSNTYVTSASTTSQPTTFTYYLTYKFAVLSSSALMTGNITNPTVLNSVQAMVHSVFNLTGFSITVIRIEIRAQKKTVTNDMLTYIQFQTSSSTCDETCIKTAASSTTPTQNFTLLAANSTLIDASAQSAATFTGDASSGTTAAPTINYQIGESPPGTAARLGMGLGITFIGILLIVEVVFLYRKYGFNRPTRQSNYEVPSYHRRLSD